MDFVCINTNYNVVVNDRPTTLALSLVITYKSKGNETIIIVILIWSVMLNAFYLCM